MLQNHQSLQHLTTDDIKHCVCQDHDIIPLALHFRAAYVDDDKQLLEEYIQSLPLPVTLTQQLLEHLQNDSLSRQLSFLAPCGPNHKDQDLCSTLLAVPLQYITDHPTVRHIFEQTHQEQLNVTQVYITGFSELIFQVRATSSTFFLFMIKLIFATNTSPSLDFPITILAPTSKVQPLLRAFLSIPV